ncbi:MAG TPA: hypothetical protein VGJ91_13990 [Polyangiaceae bacterium]
MSTRRHLLLLLSCTPALALACASRPELMRSKPTLPDAARSHVEAALPSVELPSVAPRATDPYAPIRSGKVGIYSWQSEKRAACTAESSAQELEPKLEPNAARSVLAALPERAPEPTTKAQAVTPDFVVAGLRPAIHHCFSRWLDAKLDAQGSVRIALELGCTGEVEAISAENQGVNESTLGCLFAAVAPAHFAPPVAGHATVLVPVVFKNAAR